MIVIEPVVESELVEVEQNTYGNISYTYESGCGCSEGLSDYFGEILGQSQILQIVSSLYDAQLHAVAVDGGDEFPVVFALFEAEVGD
jgi:hypothetical protein